MNNLKWPYFSEKDKLRVMSCIENNKLWRGNSQFIFDLEKSFSKLHNSRYSLAVTNGTHALEIALFASGVGFGDEVLVPAYTFISTVTAVLMRGAFPIPVDINPDDYCIDVDKIQNKLSKKTKAIIPVHISGHACDMDKIQTIARNNNIKIIEDCAHAHGASYQNKMLGSLGHFGTFSFQAMKLMTSGEGGMVITNHHSMWEKAYSFFNCGRELEGPSYNHICLSSNYRMPEISAALLLGQIDSINELNIIRNNSVNYLNEKLFFYEGIIPQSRKLYATEQGYSMYMFRYKKEYFNNKSREIFINYLKEQGFPAFSGYPVFYKTKMFDFLYKKDCRYLEKLPNKINYKKIETPCANQISEEIVWFPHFFLLENNNIFDSLVEAIKKFRIL